MKQKEQEFELEKTESNHLCETGRIKKIREILSEAHGSKRPG